VDPDRPTSSRGRTAAEPVKVNLNALSGMQAADRQLATTAGNVANLNTPGYRERRTDLATSASGGVVTRESEASEPGVDLAGQMVDLVTGSLLHSANARMLEATLETERSIFDVRV
jgi:flagellar basal body rod protein FlgG